MAKLSNKRFTRETGIRSYRKRYVVSVEGQITEPQYFNMLNSQTSTIYIQCLSDSCKSSPAHVLKRMRQFLATKSLKGDDEAWLVVDKDNWTDEQLKELHGWAKTDPNYGFALSNPKFEYWLLLHFEDAQGITTSNKCTSQLKKHFSEYHKHIYLRFFTPDRIKQAIQRARQKDTPPCCDWPRTPGTTVYRLVEKILAE